MAWEIILVEEVHDWYFELEGDDPDSAALVRAAITHHWDEGPSLGRPYVDTISSSHLRNLKELRPGSSGRSEIRMLFVFDPARQAIPLAEQRYERWLTGEYSGELKRVGITHGKRRWRNRASAVALMKDVSSSTPRS